MNYHYFATSSEFPIENPLKNGTYKAVMADKLL